MKVLILISILMSSLLLQGQVVFFNSYVDAGQRAMDQDKPIFVHVCISNNRKCKKMAEEVFSDMEIADILNLNFLNVTIDPNSDPIFAKAFNIKSVPTIIFIDKNGSEISRFEGYKEASLTKKAIKSETRQITDISTLRRRYLSQKRDNSILLEYYNVLKNSGFSSDARRLVPQFFNNVESTIDSSDLEFILRSADHPRSQSFRYILEHLPRFDATYGVIKISDQLMNSFIGGISDDKREDMDYITKRMKSVFRGYDYQRFLDAFIIESYRDAEEKERIHSYCASSWRRLKRLNCSDMEHYNSIVVAIMIKKQDIPFLEALEEELSICFETTADIASLDLLSVLNYKLGKKDQALKMVQQATKMAFNEQKKFGSSLPYFKKIGFIK